MRDDLGFASLSRPEDAVMLADPPLDRIFVRNLVQEIEIGAFTEERGVRQRLRFNVAVEVRAATGPVQDNADRIVSYDSITAAIRSISEGDRIDLLETFAERLAQLCLVDGRAARAHVRIEKLDRAPGALGVEIVRSRPPEDGNVVAMAQPAVLTARSAPTVIVVGDDVLFSAERSAWIDAAASGPSILSPAPTRLMGAAVAAGGELAIDPLTQARWAMLSMQQAAWGLAAQDNRLAVADTATAIEAELQGGRIPVWSPARLPESDFSAAELASALRLSAWLAEQLGGGSVVYAGADLPEDAPRSNAAHASAPAVLAALLTT
jgi:dihydroneopterin aldolase